MTDLVEQWKEAAKLDDVLDSMVPSDIRQLVGDIERLRVALDDIAKGMVPASEMPSLDDKHEFRYKMWQWSQERARAALLVSLG